MKKVWMLLPGLALLTSLSFAQQASISKGGLSGGSGMNSADLYQGMNFSPNLSLSTESNLTSFTVGKSFGAMNLGLNSKPKASSDDDNPVFPAGCLLANLGIGVGDLYWGGAYGSVLGVTPTLDVDIAITKKLGIGNIGIGGTVAYTSTSYNYDNGYGNTSYKYNAILIGLRGTYHFMLNTDKLKEKLDPYAGVLLGYIITNNPSFQVGTGYYGGTKASAFQPGIFAGAHYYFVQHFGVFAELGYNGFSIFTFGITLKTK
jgi:hypothetical protein